MQLVVGRGFEKSTPLTIALDKGVGRDKKDMQQVLKEMGKKLLFFTKGLDTDDHDETIMSLNSDDD